MKTLVSITALAVCSMCASSSFVEEATPVSGSCAGSYEAPAASCSGSYSAPARVTVFRRAPVRTFLKNRPKRLRNLFSIRPSCGG